MAAPCYASTEWVGLGHANLRFRPKRKTTEAVEAIQIDCYLSSVYIREYGEKKQKVKEEETREPQNDTKPPGIPPNLWTEWEEYWKNWKEVLIPLSWIHKYREHCTPDFITWHDSYLEDYPDILPLITDELGRSELCTDTAKESSENKTSQPESQSDFIDYDYLYSEQEQNDGNGGTVQEAVDGEAGATEKKEHEQDDQGREEGQKDAMKQSTNFHQEHATGRTGDVDAAANTAEEERKKVLDELYEKHQKSRYWVHLRQFLHLSGVECHPEIEIFFEQKAGIKFIQPSAEFCSNTTKDTEEISSAVNAGSCLLEGEDHPEERLSQGRQRKRKRKDKQKSQENNADAPTGSLSGPQEAETGGSNSEKEKLNGDSSEENKNTEPEGMEVEGSSSGEEGSEEAAKSVTENNPSNSSHNKHKKMKKRKKDTARPQGLSWALKYVQQKEPKQAEPTSMAPEPQEAALGTPEVAPEAALQTPEAAHGTPEVAPEAALGTPEAAHGTPETALGTLEAAHGTPEVAPEAALGTPEVVPGPSVPITALESDDEGDGIRLILDYIAETEQEFWKKYNRDQEEKALRESLQKPTGLAHLVSVWQPVVKRAADALQDLTLPLTAVHLLNLSFPGAAVMEYESSVTEDVPGEREKLKLRFHSTIYDEKVRLKRYLTSLGKFCLTTWTDAVVPISVSHLTNLVFQNGSDIEHKFPPVLFGVRWLPEPEESLQVDGKNVKRCQRRLHKFLEAMEPTLSPAATVELRGLIMHRMTSSEQDPRKPQCLYQQVVKEEEEDRTEGSSQCLTLHTLHLLQDNSKASACGSDESTEVDWSKMKVTFDENGYSGVTNTGPASQSTEEDAKAKAEEEMWQRIISGCRRLAFYDTENSLPSHLPREIQKYWAQRYRLFLKYDEGIKLDTESWYSVTPELLAAHQARRCRCEVVVDALCGAGGNAIQLAKTCTHVIAIDKDPKKIALARHNAEVYGVAHRIDFRVGDFFKLAPSIKADVVYLSPPWGGMEYQEESVYNVYRLGGSMNCARLLRTARAITPNVALYLPRNSNLFQVIALAGANGVVDIEANYMGPKKKAITAYFGDLATNLEGC